MLTREDLIFAVLVGFLISLVATPLAYSDIEWKAVSGVGMLISIIPLFYRVLWVPPGRIKSVRADEKAVKKPTI